MSDTISRYQNLSAPEQGVIQLLAMAYEPLTRSAIMKLLRRLEIKSGQGIFFTAVTLSELLRSLGERGLITIGADDITGDPELMLFCVREAMEQGRLISLSETVQEILPVALGWSGGYTFKNYTRFLRHLRYELFKSDSWATINTLFNSAPYQFRALMLKESPLVTLFNHPFDGAPICCSFPASSSKWSSPASSWRPGRH